MKKQKNLIVVRKLLKGKALLFLKIDSRTKNLKKTPFVYVIVVFLVKKMKRSLKSILKIFFLIDLRSLRQTILNIGRLDSRSKNKLTSIGLGSAAKFFGLTGALPQLLQASFFLVLARALQVTYKPENAGEYELSDEDLETLKEIAELPKRSFERMIPFEPRDRFLSHYHAIKNIKKDIVKSEIKLEKLDLDYSDDMLNRDTSIAIEAEKIEQLQKDEHASRTLTGTSSGNDELANRSTLHAKIVQDSLACIKNKMKLEEEKFNATSTFEKESADVREKLSKLVKVELAEEEKYFGSLLEQLIETLKETQESTETTEEKKSSLSLFKKLLKKKDT
jgi:hypothetical protein